MKINPPIRVSCKQGDGHIIEKNDDGNVIKLLNGEIITIDTEQPAKVYKDPESECGYRIVIDDAQ